MIYFMQAAGGGPIKIGHTATPSNRFLALENGAGESLNVLATLPGDRPEEQELHRRFDHLRLEPFRTCEWFRPDAELLEFIAREGRPWDGSDEAPRLSVLNLKGSPEYRDWLGLISKKSLIPVTTIVRDAVGKWAKERGYPQPPEV